MASVQIRSVGLAREVYVPRGPVPASPEAVDALVECLGDLRIRDQSDASRNRSSSFPSACAHGGMHEINPLAPATYGY